MVVVLAGLSWGADRTIRPEDAPDAVWAPAPAWRLQYSNSTFARVNPLGFIDVFRLGMRRRLSASDSLLLKDTSVFAGMSVIATPAFARVGGTVEVQPLSVLRVFAGADVGGWFGTFDQVASFPDSTAQYDDRTLSELGAAGGTAATTGSSVWTGFTLLGAAGPMVVRSTTQFIRYDLDLPGGDTAFYDQYWDRLAPDGAFQVLQDNDLLALTGKARIGVRHTFSDGLDGAIGDGGLSHHRVGPLLAWQFSDKTRGPMVAPTAFVIAQWWLQHPYRTGAEQPQGLPLIAAGFSFQGDLWSTKD
jgi:hypothetical protein